MELVQYEVRDRVAHVTIANGKANALSPDVLAGLAEALTRAEDAGEPEVGAPCAAILVGGYSGLGVHTFLNALRFGPGQFKGTVFLSVGVVDSGNFKGSDAVEDLERTRPNRLNNMSIMPGGWACRRWAICRSAPTPSTNWNICASP